MWEYLMESPWTVGLTGAVATAAALFIWTQTRQRAVGLAAAVLFLTTAVLVVTSLNVRTDREQIRQTMEEVAGALDRNDHQAVFAFIHPDAEEGVQRARSELPNYIFHQARITGIRSIAVNHGVSPPAAIAEFHVNVEIEAHGQRLRVRRFVRAFFLLYGDRWLVYD